MKKVLILAATLVTAFVLVACGGTPANVYEFIIDENYTEFITVGTSADFPPFEGLVQVGKKTEVQGIDIEIAKEIAKKVRKNLKVVDKNFDFLIQDLEDKKIDFIMAGLTINEDREKKVLFSDFYYEAQDVMVIHKDTKDKFNTIDSLNTKGIVLGTQSGTVQVETLMNDFKNATPKIVPSNINLINELNDKRIHGVLLDKPVADGFLKKYPNLMLSEAEFPEGEDQFAVAVNKEATEFLLKINEVIKELKESGKLQEIFDKELSKE